MTGGLLSQAELKDTGTFGSFLLAEAGSHRNQAFKEQRQGLMVDSPFHLNIWLAQSGHNLSCPGYITGRLEKWMGLPRTAGGGSLLSQVQCLTSQASPKLSHIGEIFLLLTHGKEAQRGGVAW